MRRGAFAVISILALISAVQAQEDWCDAIPNAKVKRVVYCESLPIGTTQDGAFAVSLESKFFEGLQRTKTDGRAEFQKDKRDVSAYPDSFIVAVEKNPVIVSTGSGTIIAPGGPDRPVKQKKPRKVMLRWLSESGIVIREITADLEEMRQPWPEMNPPEIWYRAKIDGAAEPLSSELEIVLIGESGEHLGEVKRFL
jgi:hypothetical protein